MAYKIPVVSPSALAATEQCPRFRPDGEENDAALEGTMLHECLEQLVAQPPETWMEWIATRELSAEHKGLLEEAAEQLQTIMEPGMQVFTEKKLKPRYRQGRRINQRLRPGAYPELEIETAPGRHGYIDLLLVLSSGIYVVIDYKFERQAKVHDLQLAKYCARVQELVPSAEHFEARIISPRLQDEEIEKYMWTRADLDAYRGRIARIEELADRSANDPSVPGCPSNACQYCHSKGRCPYQAGGVLEVAETMQVLSKVVIPNGVYQGERLTAETFTAPATLAQRGLRRACIKFLESAIEEWKKDDAKWSADSRGEDGTVLSPPGWKVSFSRGRAKLDDTRMSEIREAVMSKFNMPLEDVIQACTLSTTKLAEQLAESQGWSEKRAKDEVQRALDGFMTPGAPYPVWRQSSK